MTKGTSRSEGWRERLSFIMDTFNKTITFALDLEESNRFTYTERVAGYRFRV